MFQALPKEMLLPLSLVSTPTSQTIHVPLSETHNTGLSSLLWGYATFVVASVVSPDGARTIAGLVF